MRPRRGPNESKEPPPAPDDYSRRLDHPSPPRFKFQAWEFLNNPDRYPSISLTESALETVDGHQSTVSNGVEKVHGEAFFTQTHIVTGILPLADWFSLTLAGGITLNEFFAAQTQQFALTANDNSVGTYSAGLRFFLVGTEPFWDDQKNPDRWTSIGLTGGGTTSMQYDVVNSVNNILQPVNTQSWRLDLDTRLPLCDWYTVVPDAYFLYQQSQAPEVTAINGSVSHLRILGGSVEQRFYLVGRNLLFDDKGRNPDRWTSLYLDLGGQSALSGDQSVTSAGVSMSRGDTTKSMSAAAGVRLPMTGHATLRLETDLSYTDGTVPEIPNFAASTRRRQLQLGGLASFRYYVF